MIRHFTRGFFRGFAETFYYLIRVPLGIICLPVHLILAPIIAAVVCESSTEYADTMEGLFSYKNMRQIVLGDS